MSIDKETVVKVARLACLDMSEDELARVGPQINGILKWMEQLNEVDTEGVEPLANVVNIDLKLRADEVTDGDCSKAVLANAPEETQGFFVVPKVVEQEG
ncbi:MAG: Asp-tRNA(Asn)/Glu-tRNA(Gln) amidotransferase subunit GatC [Alphaproteobacteria bacterium]|nr:Asp-tRNA(Asn)/Glu-tRNA(Gln) amidotransferase subunit GatC [Alphaproteobacteria bacterium]